MHTVLRFLRFQAPWAYGRRVFALLRRALTERWVNIHHRLMDAVEKWRVRGHSERVAIRSTRNEEMRITNILVVRDGYGGLLSKGGNGVRQGFYTRIGVGLLTKFCKRPHPRAVVFGIIARCYGSVVASGVVLPVRAREGRLKTGVSGRVSKR